MLTYYHGRCELFQVKETLAPLEYATFVVHPNNVSYLVYIFEEGEEKSLTFEVFFNPVSMMDFEESLVSKTL